MKLLSSPIFMLIKERDNKKLIALMRKLERSEQKK